LSNCSLKFIHHDKCGNSRSDSNNVYIINELQGSVVGFALNDDGSPFFVFSTMSAHTTDLLKDGRASLTVMANDFKGAAEGRVVLIADVVKVFDAEEREKLRTKYLARHPGAYWADFG
jgi:putative heme iron utilization protein